MPMLKRLRPLVISLLDARGLQRQRHSEQTGRSGLPGTRSGENAIYERRTDLPGRRHVFGDFGLLDPATPHRLGDRPDRRGRRLRTRTTAAGTHRQPIKISNKPRERGESDLSSFLSYFLCRRPPPDARSARERRTAKTARDACRAPLAVPSYEFLKRNRIPFSHDTPRMPPESATQSARGRRRKTGPPPRRPQASPIFGPPPSGKSPGRERCEEGISILPTLLS